jgi:hypothetical protein
MTVVTNLVSLSQMLRQRRQQETKEGGDPG